MPHSVEFNHSVVSNSLRPHGLQHIRVPCPSPVPGACSNSCLSIKLVMPTNYLILCCPLLFLPLIFPTIRVFSNESVLCIRWPKYWSFSFSISPSNEYSELISFRTDWFNLLAVQRTVKSLLQHNSSKASIIQHSPFLLVQFSHLHMTTWKTIALTRWTFSAKWCLCFYVHCLGLSCLLPSFPSKQQGSFNFMAVVNVMVILETKKINCVTVFTYSSSTYHEVMGPVELFQNPKDDAVKVLHSICQQIWKTQQWPQDWKSSLFIPIPKKGNAKVCSNYRTIALISHDNK